MYVPIVIDPCSFYDYRYLWEYLMYMYKCFKNDWPIVAEENYRDYKVKRPISNVYEEQFCAYHQYSLLTEQEEASVKKYFIDKQIFEKLEEECGSKLGVRLFLLQNRYQPLEKEIRKIFRQIKRDTGKEIKGILNWNSHFKSIRYIARKKGIPLITNEFCLRFPEFFSVGYFCKEDIYSVKEISKAYNAFKREQHKLSFQILTRKELLALLLKKDRLFYIEEAEKINNVFEIGIAGCHPLIPTFFSKSTYTDLELIEDVRKEYSELDILFRKHPGDEPYQAEYTLQNKDNSNYASEFIHKCKRITAIGSNTILEALLWGKTVYTNEISPFSIFCKKQLHDKEEVCIDDAALNFIIFGYLVPYSQMFNPSYMDWRISEKNILKIMEENIKYCLEEQSIPINIMNMGEQRYNYIIKYKEDRI